MIAVHEPPAGTERGPHALVLSPVLPRWDRGAFFAPIIRALTSWGWRVTAVDTLALLGDDVTTVPELAGRWSAERARFGPVDLLAGNALGGAVAQALLPLWRPPAVFLLSAPSRADDVLTARLSSIAELAEAGDLPTALARLARLVTPDGVTAPVAGSGSGSGDTAAEPAAGHRIARGMRLLAELDVIRQVSAYCGPLLHTVGSRSRLVTAAHVAAAAHHEIFTVEGAGMRPHMDDPQAVTDRLAHFLKEHDIR